MRNFSTSISPSRTDTRKASIAASRSPTAVCQRVSSCFNSSFLSTVALTDAFSTSSRSSSSLLCVTSLCIWRLMLSRVASSFSRNKSFSALYFSVSSFEFRAAVRAGPSASICKSFASTALTKSPAAFSFRLCSKSIFFKSKRKDSQTPCTRRNSFVTRSFFSFARNSFSFASRTSRSNVASAAAFDSSASFAARVRHSFSLTSCADVTLPVSTSCLNRLASLRYPSVSLVASFIFSSHRRVISRTFSSASSRKRANSARALSASRLKICVFSSARRFASSTRPDDSSTNRRASPRASALPDSASLVARSSSFACRFSVSLAVSLCVSINARNSVFALEASASAYRASLCAPAVSLRAPTKSASIETIRSRSEAFNLANSSLCAQSASRSTFTMALACKLCVTIASCSLNRSDASRNAVRIA
mmetsp:Transcript_9213/g.34426  ORF Transcript_9213/g.34426 Transcript_9213/m.34426 type:complete len:422 (+) Transcript_9213:389-1654(+)